MRIGPIALRYALISGEPVRSGTLAVTPVARHIEVDWQSPGGQIRWLWTTPHHVAVATLAGERRIRIDRAGGWLVAAAVALPLIVAALLGWRDQRQGGSV